MKLAVLALALFVLTITAACAQGDPQAQGERSERPAQTQQASEGPAEEGAPEPTDSPAEGDKEDEEQQAMQEEPDYATLTDGGLSIEVPKGWDETQLGSVSEDGSSWTEFASVPVTSSITASPDLDEWASGTAPVGVYAVASASMLRDYGVETLVDFGRNDASAVCAPGERRDFEREPYSGYVQEWTGCNGQADATLLTFSAAPDGGGCVVVMQAGMTSDADREAALHILDSFEADCGKVSGLEDEWLAANAELSTPEEEAVGCEDFVTASGEPSQLQAQQFYDFNATPDQRATLDPDGNGYACDGGTIAPPGEAPAPEDPAASPIQPGTPEACEGIAEQTAFEECVAQNG